MAHKQPQDPYAQQAKKLTSLVQRLRGWVGTDPSKAPELGDALNALTAHRLLGHQYAEAAADAQAAVVSAAKLLASHGPIGPYTPMPDAARYFTATVHLAAIQVGVGLPDAAGRTMDAALEWKRQLPKAGLDELLDPRTAVWALCAVARAALTEGALARANAYADAAWARLVEAGLVGTGLLELDVRRLVSDCRWAAGLDGDALAQLRLALAAHQDMAGPLAQPAGLSPALLERLAEPVFGLHRDLADRLVATGDVAAGLQVRRSAVDLLAALAGRRVETGAAQLALTLVDLASDLLASGRIDEAGSLADRAAQLSGGLTAPMREAVELLVVPVRARTLARRGHGDEAIESLEPVLIAVAARDEATAADLVALSVLVEAQRSIGATQEADATSRACDEAAQPLLAGLDWARFGAVDVDVVLRDLARGVVTRSVQPSPRWEALDADASLAGVTAGAGAAEVAAGLLQERRQAEAQAEALRAAAERREAEAAAAARAQAERLAAEHRESERLAAERAEAERRAAEQAELERRESERLAAERHAAEEAAARLVAKRQREERILAHRLEAERLAAEKEEAERRELRRRNGAPEESGPDREQQELEQLAAELAELERAEVAAVRAAAERQAFEEAARVEAVRSAAQEAARAEAARRVAVEEAERVEAERLEADRAEAGRLAAEAERREAERAEAERLAAEAERVAVEAERVEAQPRAVEDEVLAVAERAASQEPSEGRSEPTELRAAQEDLRAAKADGDKRRIRDACEMVVELLRPLADVETERYLPELVAALEALASARWQSGDWWGSRGPAKEAKALARDHGV